MFMLTASVPRPLRPLRSPSRSLQYIRAALARSRAPAHAHAPTPTPKRTPTHHAPARAITRACTGAHAPTYPYAYMRPHARKPTRICAGRPLHPAVVALQTCILKHDSPTPEERYRAITSLCPRDRVGPKIIAAKLPMDARGRRSGHHAKEHCAEPGIP